jgi:putative NADH-flavin reductase
MSTKKITLFTTSDVIGKKIAEEALQKGFVVKVIVPDRDSFQLNHGNLTIRNGDVNKNKDVSKHAKDADIVIYVYELRKNQEGECYNATRSVLMGIKEAGVNSLILSAYANQEPSGTSREEYEAWRVVQEEQLAALRLLKKSPEVSWSYYYTLHNELKKDNILQIKTTNSSPEVPSVNSLPSLEEYAGVILQQVEKAISLNRKSKESLFFTNDLESNKATNRLLN